MGKTRNRDDIEDRTMVYRDKRREHKFGYSQDVDQLEFFFYKDRIEYVASLELTRVDHNPKYPDGPTDRYFEKILERFHHDAQAKISIDVAKRLGIEAYIVAFSDDAERYWVYNLNQGIGWIKCGSESYFAWLQWKHNMALGLVLEREHEEAQVLHQLENDVQEMT